jgi:hypothetical protein
MKIKLSYLWIFVLFNYLYCDILAFMDSEVLKGFLAGNVEGIQFTPSFLLTMSILMEIPIAMILIARFAPYRINRWANIVAGFIMTTAQASSLFFGSTPSMYYIFFSVIEITCTLLIIYYSWKWRKAEK